MQAILTDSQLSWVNRWPPREPLPRGAMVTAIAETKRQALEPAFSGCDQSRTSCQLRSRLAAPTMKRQPTWLARTPKRARVLRVWAAIDTHDLALRGSHSLLTAGLDMHGPSDSGGHTRGHICQGAPYLLTR